MRKKNKANTQRNRTPWLIGLLSFLIAFFSYTAAFAQFPIAENSEDCMDCHDANEEVVMSVHDGIECIECHVKFPLDIDADDVHSTEIPQPSCNTECHGNENSQFKKGAHGKRSKLYEFFTEHGDDATTCWQCHGSHDVKSPLEPESKTYHLIDEWVTESVHDGLECQDCHVSLSDNQEHTEFKCKSCHEDVDKTYQKSIHGVALAQGDKDSARCYDCHGSHHILNVDNEKSMVYPFNLPATCGVCHSNKEITLKHNIDEPNAVNLYIDSMHGKGLLKMGLIVAPSCNDCHGVHNIQKHEHPDSLINHKNIPDTCGKCHKKVESTYMDSVHGQLLQKGDPEGPVCVDCHVSHDIGVLDDKGRMIHADRTCGKCHEEKLERYRETYHGKAMALGEGDVAACFDCHGSHDIYPSDDIRSKLFRGTDRNGKEVDHLIETCRTCHEGAPKQFAGYMTHANHSDSENNPILYWVYISMTSLLLGTFAFFGLHTILWLTRTLYFRFKDPEGFKHAKINIQKDEEIFTRFKPVDRFLHGLVIISFLLLVITGMPIKFYDTKWAEIMFIMLGGSETARSLHRLGAFITIIYFSIHLIVLFNRTMRAWKESRKEYDGSLTWQGLKSILVGPDSPVPNKQDWHDLVAHQKFFFGKGPRPQFDRWTYWEKFDYWAVFWGVAVIGLSGLIMWFPVFFTNFLPGIAINIALIIHSDEALLAAGFIFTFHFFNVHFRPEKFPIDSVIFSGRISRAEMEHERGRYLERLEKEGKIEDVKHNKDEWESWKKIMHPFGYTAFGIGVLLIILIYAAMGSRLF